MGEQFSFGGERLRSQKFRIPRILLDFSMRRQRFEHVGAYCPLNKKNKLHPNKLGGLPEESAGGKSKYSA